MSQLNDEGRSTALDRVRELTEIPRYQDTDGRRAAQEYNRSKIESMKDVESSADVQRSFESLAVGESCQRAILGKNGCDMPQRMHRMPPGI